MNENEFFALSAESLTNVSKLLELMPDISVPDIAKYMAISGLVLQQEAYKVLADLQGIEAMRKMKRLHQVNEMLGTAAHILRDASNLTIKVHGQKKAHRQSIIEGKGLRLISSQA